MKSMTMTNLLTAAEQAQILVALAPMFPESTAELAASNTALFDAISHVIVERIAADRQQVLAQVKKARMRIADLYEQTRIETETALRGVVEDILR
jgi:hypothetical protein